MIIVKSKYLFIRNLALFLLIFCSLQRTVKSQDAVYSQFMFDALTVNPGLVGINDYNKFSVGFRDQWQQINHAYVTFFASYDMHAPNINSGFGFQIYRDMAGGVYSRTSTEIYYNYRFKLTPSTFVSPGLKVALVQRSFDASGFTFPDPTVGSDVVASRSKMFPDFSFGAVLNHSDIFSLGFAAHHLNGISFSQETLSEIGQERTPFRVSAHIISYFPLYFGMFDRHRFVVSPGAYFMKQQQSDFATVGANLAFDPVFVGVWMRAASFQPEAAIFMAGIEHTHLRIVYNFDYKLANAKSEFPGTGAHEVVLTWKIHPPKRMQAVKCSKFDLYQRKKKNNRRR